MLKSSATLSESEAPLPLLMGSPPTPSDAERETKELEQENKSASKSSEKQEEDKGADKAAVTATEDKAAKIERLRSGFRICRPQGTFLWPNMAMSPQSTVHFEDLLVVPTPPSTSSTTSAPHLLPQRNSQLGPYPDSPVKPLAERLPISNAILNGVSKPLPSPPPPPETPNTTAKSSLINLNELPRIQQSDAAFCGTITYQRRQQSVSISLPRPLGSFRTVRLNLFNVGAFKLYIQAAMTKNEDGTESKDKTMTRDCDEQYQQITAPCGCFSSTSNSSWLPSGDGWWLALATTNTSVDRSNRG